MKEELKKSLQEIGIEGEEFDQAWNNFFQEAKQEGKPDEEAGKVATTNTRRYYRKITKEPAVVYENHIYMGCGSLTDWASIGRRNRNQPKNVKPEDMLYQVGMNKGKVIPKYDYDKTYYFMKPDGEMYNIRSRHAIGWKSENETEEEAGEKEKKIMEQFFPTLQSNKKYKLRVKEKTSSDGRLFRSFAPYTKFDICGEGNKEEILNKFRKLNLVDIGNTPELPDIFVVDVDVIDISENFGREDILVEDESIFNDMKAHYSVQFDKGTFRVPEEGHAQIIVKPIFNKTGDFSGLEGISYFSDDVVETEEIKDADWVAGGDDNASA